MRQLPPLNAVRAFEAAARHESFAKAAEELFVTPAAVSQQVKTLEDWLELTLFQRHARGLHLTPAGRAYLPWLTDALDRLASATETVRRMGQTHVLTVGVTPGFASLWLGPRLWSFASKHPELDIRVTATSRPVQADEEQMDLIIRFGRGEYPNMHVELLFEDGLTPVCSPELQQGPHPLRTPSDLKYHTLLHNEAVVLAGFRASWQDWLDAAGARDVDGRRGLHFSDFPLVLQEALAGRGVGLGHIALIQQELRAGRLIQPFEHVLHPGGNYYIVHRRGAEQQPKVAAFLDWLRLEAARDRSGGETDEHRCA